MKRIVVFALVLNAALLGVIAHQLVAIAGGGAVATQNGDTNGDGGRDIGDAVYLLSWLFQGGAEPVAFAGGPDHSEAIAELQAQVAVLRSSQVAIGSFAGNTNQANNSIVINATDEPLGNTTANSFVVKPVRGLERTEEMGLGRPFNLLFYNADTGEIVYAINDGI